MLNKASIWELVEPPAGANIIRSKWVFPVKKNTTENLVCNKVYLIIEGFSQVPSVDYFDTYAPVIKLASIHTVPTLAAHLDLKLHQINIKSAYFNGELNNDQAVYICQLPGYADPAHSCHVCCLHEILYRLK